MFAWAQNSEWPFFQYVADELEGQGISDAAGVLGSFPTLGTRDNMGRSYRDVIYDHTYPAPRDDSQVSLSVAGLSRHDAGVEMAQGFVAVLGYAAEKYVRTPTDPTKIVEVEVSSEERAGLKSYWWPPHVLHATGLLLRSEWAQGVQHLGGPTDSREWRIRVGRGIRRYLGLTLDKYTELIRADIEEAEAVSRKYRAAQFTDQRGWTALIADGTSNPVFSSVTSEDVEMPDESTTLVSWRAKHDLRGTRPRRRAEGHRCPIARTSNLGRGRHPARAGGQGTDRNREVRVARSASDVRGRSPHARRRGSQEGR